MPEIPLRPRPLALALGCYQVVSWGVSFYLPAVIAAPAAQSLGAARVAVVGGISWALLIAGAIAPRIGRRIDRSGGRPVLAAGSLVIAAGLILLALSPDLALWYLGWTVLGIGMALGLYDAAFATVGCLLGAEAAPVITGITLIAGFASTIFWPLGTFLATAIGWRDLLLLYAGLELALNLPLVLVFVPHFISLSHQIAPPAAQCSPERAASFRSFCLAVYFTLRWLITSAIAVYVLVLFSGIGLTRAHAVFAAALFGPSQVAGRILDWALTGWLGILARARLAAALLPLGIALLLLGGPHAAPAFAVLYGMSNGVLTINRGTLPMAIFGPAGYAARLGWLAMPVLLAQAAAPTLAAPLLAIMRPACVFLLAGLLASLAGLFLIPLRAARLSPS
ncbi:MAG TPA: MFS transporter [Acetobacteraceae bacterium]|nr:MFS transporter [Acetobacteraceae bacterium]